jgi:hypothetical protein
MIQIDKTVVSFDVFEKKFCCNLQKCKGACCIHGDSGAPLKEEEAELLEKIYPLVKPYLREDGIKAIELKGCYTIDTDGDLVTPLINNEECAFVIFENGIAKCGIEKAYEEKIIDFQKPISCHLYPIRVTKYSSFEAINYHQWDICKHALAEGKKNNLPLYIFLKNPLCREYGAEWYLQLEIAANEYKKYK